MWLVVVNGTAFHICRNVFYVALKSWFFGCGEVQYFDPWDNNRTVAAAMPSSVFEEHIKQHGDLKLLMADTPHNYKTKSGSCFYFHTFFSLFATSLMLAELQILCLPFSLMSKNIIAMKIHKIQQVPVRGWFVLLISIYTAEQRLFAPSKVKLNIVSVEKSSFKRRWSIDWNK